MERPRLDARRRTVVGKQVRALRRQGMIPAVLYGTGIEPAPLELDGREGPAGKTFGGILVTGVDEIEVEALPADLPNRVTVDLGPLTEIGKAITVGDLFIGKAAN